MQAPSYLPRQPAGGAGGRWHWALPAPGRSNGNGGGRWGQTRGGEGHAPQGRGKVPGSLRTPSSRRNWPCWRQAPAEPPWGSCPSFSLGDSEWGLLQGLREEQKQVLPALPSKSTPIPPIFCPFVHLHLVQPHHRPRGPMQPFPALAPTICPPPEARGRLCPQPSSAPTSLG